MGYAVTFVIFVSSIVTWLIYNCILVPLKIEYLDLITFILVIASLVQFVEMFLKKTSPEIYKSMGISVKKYNQILDRLIKAVEEVMYSR